MDFINIEDFNSIGKKHLDKMYKEHYNEGLYKLFKLIGIDKEFTRAYGIHVYDKEGNDYIDFLGGFGALNLGHNNNEVINALNKVILRPNMLQISQNPYEAILANNISFLTHGKLSNCFFTNSGTESVEEALKLALFYKKGGNIIYFTKGFHGKTIGSLSALGSKIKNKYKPLLYNFLEIPYGDIEKFKEAVEIYKISGVIVELVQGEGGIVVGSEEFFKDIREICDKKNIILIFDEVQTGFGRCGSMFCYERFGVVPDVMCLAKSLSGGIIPIGCIAVKKSLWNKTYGKIKNCKLIGSTFGGNTFACVAGIKALSLIREENLPKRAMDLGIYTMEKLKNLKKKHKIIKDVRGMGLMLGVEIDNMNGVIPKKVMELSMSNIISKLMNKYRIISGFTINNPCVLRIEPPLIIDKEQIDYLIYALDRIFENNDDVLKLSLQSTKDTFKNAF